VKFALPTGARVLSTTFSVLSHRRTLHYTLHTSGTCQALQDSYTNYLVLTVALQRRYYVPSILEEDEAWRNDQTWQVTTLIKAQWFLSFSFQKVMPFLLCLCANCKQSRMLPYPQKKTILNASFKNK
jgi:hypothetical protein